MTVLVALALAAAPACPAGLTAAGLADAELARRAPAIVEALEDAGVGPTAAVDAAARALAAAEPERAHAAAAAFRGALARQCALAAAPPLPAASAADREALAEVLARPELSRVPLDPWAIRRALLAFWDRLVELLGTSEAERYASLGRALLLGAAAAALVLGVAAARRRREGREGRHRARGDEPGSAPRAPPEEGATLAEEALRRGEAREAVRLALLAALAALERAGRVPRGRAMTNEEIVRACSSTSTSTTATSTSTSTSTSTPTSTPTPTPTPTPTATPTSTATPTPTSTDLALLALAFDRAVYGGLPVTPDDARGAVTRARRVVHAVGGAP